MGLDVGVLLPLRIETRFGPGTLRVRVVPDEPWLARHDPRVSAAEVDLLRRYVDATDGTAEAAAALTPARRDLAWRDLAGSVGGGARAVHLVRTLVVPGPDGRPAVREPDPGELRTEPRFPRLEGFPDTLHVWLVRAGGAPTEVAVLAVDQARLLLDFPDPDAPAERRWWEHWDEAVAAGLAVELPLPGDPADIDVLVVTGLGSADPATLFGDHRDAGRLGLLAPGEPTNTVDGAPAADLGREPVQWLRLLSAAPGEDEQALSAALTGDPFLLGALPGSAQRQTGSGTAMVAGLWPALWGFAAGDVWAVPGADDAGDRAPGAFAPEGPFPALRVGSQPYGVLPTTALARWVAEAGDPASEAALAGPLALLRAEYARAARARGTVAGAPTDTLLDLVGQVPTSTLLRHRAAWPLELWWLVLTLLGRPVAWDDLDRLWHRLYPAADDLGLHPARRYGAVGAPRRLGIPLVVPDKLPDAVAVGDVLKRLAELALTVPWTFARTDILEKEMLRLTPDSLLLRLAIRSLQVAIGDVGRAAGPPALDPVAQDVSAPGLLSTWISGVSAADVRSGSRAARRLQVVADALSALAGVDERRLERLLLATVDCASHRIDPWVTAVPTRRLNDAIAQGRAEMRLGAYGWVDAPRPGTPGPTAAGLIHAPSPAQALTATVLRDRAVNDGSTRWDLRLTSRTVRDADRIAEHVRVGAHLSEALGREVERVVAAPADVTRLRQAFPVRTEHAGRRVCDGLAVLAADPAALGLDAGRLAGLDRLRAAVDTYGDLLVAEAVHDVTQRRAEAAGAVMDAAAGLARPPHLDVLRTPRNGRAVATSAVLLLPDVPSPVVPADPLDAAAVSPAALADPAAAAFVADQLGSDWIFEVTVGAAVTPVTLADLRLSPADALALPVTDLARLAVEQAVTDLGLDPDDPDEAAAAAGAAVTGGNGVRRYEAAARLVALVGRNPAGPDAVSEDTGAAGSAAGMAAAGVLAELLARYTLVRGLLATVTGRLDTELASAAPDPAVLTRLLAAARSWGVAPELPAPASGAGGPGGGPRTVALARRARDLLMLRLTAAPATVPPAPGQLSPVASLPQDDLVSALAALVSPTGQVAVTARLAAAALPALDPRADDAVGQEWLPLVAAVRERFARVEAQRLAAGTPADSGPALTTWVNKGDLWQADPLDGRRLVVAFAPPGLDLATVPAGGAVAAAVVDRFTEVVPETEQSTAAVFGFDGPASRAPQALLLAVPPDPNAGWDEPTLAEAVLETRELAHARVARPADLPARLLGLLPAALLPAAGPTAVRLEPRS